jgi:peptidyl-prolyl cis-trans isomerase C
MWAQAPANPPGTDTASKLAELPPETVLATFDGKKLTAGELQKYLVVLPPQMQQGAIRDPKTFVQSFAMLQKLAQIAEENKLAEDSPTKEALLFNRMYILSNAQLTHTTQQVEIAPAEYEKYYEANKERYKQVKLKVIYVPFSSAPAEGSGGKGQLTEAAARAKIEKIAAEIRKGADFVEMVKQHSEDETSAKKAGDFGTIRHSDNLPDAIRSVVFALNKGQVSEPVRQPNGFYLFRADEVSTQPLSQAKSDIDLELRQAKSKEWIDGVVKGLDLKFEHAGFFDGAQPGPPPPPALAPSPAGAK